MLNLFMKQREYTMLRGISISVILFSSAICFGQNSQTQVKDVPSTVSTSKDGMGTHPKITPQEEYVGTKPNAIHPDSLKIMMYDPSSEKKNRITPSTDKNTNKPN